MNDSTTNPGDGQVSDRAAIIRDHIRNAIVDRRLGPGTKLSEHEVGALFDASRTVARAALQMLSFEGLVRTERNRGAFVANPTPEEAKQVFASRRLIEPGIVAQACAKVGPVDLLRFEEQLAAESQFLALRGPEARRAEIKASGNFHLLLASVVGNPILLRFMEELVARSSLVIALYGRSGASTCGHAEHEAIFAALRERDDRRASDQIISHLDHIEADLELKDRDGLRLRDAISV
jgi:DNA-binding GntR family transcriptional regulator